MKKYETTTGIKSIDKTWGDNKFITPGLNWVMGTEKNGVILTLQIANSICESYINSAIVLFDVMDKYNPEFIKNVISCNNDILIEDNFNIIKILEGDIVSSIIRVILSIYDKQKEIEYSKREPIVFILNISDVINSMSDTECSIVSLSYIRQFNEFLSEYLDEFTNHGLFILIDSDIKNKMRHSKKVSKNSLLLQENESIGCGISMISYASTITKIINKDINYELQMISKPLYMYNSADVEFDGFRFK